MDDFTRAVAYALSHKCPHFKLKNRQIDDPRIKATAAKIVGHLKLCGYRIEKGPGVGDANTSVPRPR